MASDKTLPIRPSMLDLEIQLSIIIAALKRAESSTRAVCELMPGFESKLDERFHIDDAHRDISIALKWTEQQLATFRRVRRPGGA